MGLALSSLLSSRESREIIITDISDSSDNDEEECEHSESTSEDEVLSKYRANKNIVARNMSASSSDNDCNTDAAVNTQQERITINPVTVVNVGKVLEIEKDLDFYEKVSMIYLLCENAHYSLQVLLVILNGAQKDILYEWADYEQSIGKKWQDKFIEALSVIQNYKVLRSLGLSRNNINDIYLPHLQFTSLHISQVKKCIYLICEKLNVEKTTKFLKKIKSDFIMKNLEFKEFEEMYLELYFLYWETIKYIQMDDLSNLIKIFKEMDMEEICDSLKKVSPLKRAVPNTVNVEIETKLPKKSQSSKPANNRLDDTTYFNENQDNSRLSDLESFASSVPSSLNSDNINPSVPQFIRNGNEDKYFIDSNKPGVCLIINQENFYTEIEDCYSDLLPAINYKLESRIGTKKDREILECTFTQLGFRVILKDNLTHLQMIEEIQNVVKSVEDESSLFVCIMSHGDQGLVYGVNSCRVEVNLIQDIMCKSNYKNLIGKPKILILQSCQGKECQKVPTGESDDDDLETDGPACSQAVPLTADMLVFWATVPGYGAIRNKRTGSWFIQSLCAKIKDLSNMCHLEDIFTKIVNDVSGRTWKQNKNNVAMVPLKVSTLRKPFYLPVIENI